MKKIYKLILLFIHALKKGKIDKSTKSTLISFQSWKLTDGTKFDSSYDRNQPIEFVLGQGRVIKGWDEGISYLKVGGKATFIIPSNLAYGERGAGQSIGPNTDLIFIVELLGIN